MARYSWTARTALEPSPTAEATRFIDPSRTSPTAKTPGAEVSNGNGSLPAKTGSPRASAGNGSIGEDEPLLVQRDRALDPRRSGYCADEAEEGDALLGAAASRGRVLEDDGLKVSIAIESPDLGVGQDLDAGIGRDAVDQVSRHAVREIGSANHDRNPASSLAQVDGRLPGRVPPTHDHHVTTTAGSGFQVGGGVVDPFALELFEVGDGQTLIPGTSGDDDRPSGDLALVKQRYDVESMLHTQARYLTGADQPGAQPLGLDRRSGRQIAPRDAVGESGVVLDARAGAGLATRPTASSETVSRPSEAP